MDKEALLFALDVRYGGGTRPASGLKDYCIFRNSKMLVIGAVVSTIKYFGLKRTVVSIPPQLR